MAEKPKNCLIYDDNTGFTSVYDKEGRLQMKWWGMGVPDEQTWEAVKRLLVAESAIRTS